MNGLVEFTADEIREMPNESVYMLDMGNLIDRWRSAISSSRRDDLPGVLLFMQMLENLLYYNSHWRKPEDIIASICRTNRSADERKLYDIFDKVRSAVFGSKKLINPEWGIFTAEFTYGLTSDDPYTITICYKGDYRVRQFDKQNQHLKERSGHLKRPVELKTNPRHYR